MNKVVKKVIPTGEFILLKEFIPTEQQGDVLLAESARGDKRYVVVEIGAEADTEVEVGDVVFVQLIDLIPLSLGEKEKFFMVKCEDIMGYEE